MLEQRRLPDLLTFADGSAVTAETWEARRAELVNILSREEYGFMPPAAPVSVTVKTDNASGGIYAGKQRWREVALTVETPGGPFTFPLNLFTGKTGHPQPLILYINFRPDLPDKYLPIEEITDRGYALATFCYNNVTRDENDGFSTGIAPLYDRSVYTWGKIGMWAWAASRCLDWLLTLPEIDPSQVAVAGHSRLGKTALWCGANDPRVTYVIANNSGCSGDAITRDKQGERVAQITKNFPYWFCENYTKYIEKEHEMPFDQHFLLAAVCPRFVLHGAAQEDIWADPESQFLSGIAASEAWKLLGMDGLIAPDRLPVPGDTFHQGQIGHHLRSGAHFHSRYDWNRYMDFMDAKRGS